MTRSSKFSLTFFLAGLFTFPIWVFQHYIVLFRSQSLSLFCDKNGFSSITSEKKWGHTYGSVPYDLESYTCAGVSRVFSDEEIAFYYGSFIFMIASFLLALFFLFRAIDEGKSVQSNLF